MNIWKQAIDAEADKLIRRFENYARQIADERKRRERRTTGSTTKPITYRPRYWELAEGFNPYLVRARSARIGHAIHKHIATKSYTPHSPYLHVVPKADGGLREICVFQVADSAISRLIFDRLNKKNRALMSSRAYAYRDDVSAHDAIQFIGSELRGKSRVFLAEYDFSKYFDNISHDYLWGIIRDHQFLLTAAEEVVIRSILLSKPLDFDSYDETASVARERGIPQGTSISLFLANVAAWELDRSLEKLGVSFVRYADDTLIWSTDYAQLCRAVETLHEVAGRIGTPINVEKSSGIRLLVPEGAPAEIKSTTEVEFIGHRLTLDSIGIKDSVVRRIKKRINELLYFNLIREPAAGTQDLGRLKSVDRDYVTYIWQVRRYLYGDISERVLRRFEEKGVPRRRFRGVMSFFPLIDDSKQLEALDSWLVCATCLAVRKRGRLLRTMGCPRLPKLHGLVCDELASLITHSGTTGDIVDLRIPSFRRIANVVRKAATQYGTSTVARTLKYDYQ